MSFTLKKIGDGVFTGKAGKKFKCMLTASAGDVEVQSARYGSQHSTDNPFNFLVETGQHDIIVVFEATDPDSNLTLSEVAGGKQTLAKISANAPFPGLSVEVQSGPTVASKSAIKKAAAQKKAKKTTKKGISK
jgi:hypothetical protein